MFHYDENIMQSFIILILSLLYNHCFTVTKIFFYNVETVQYAEENPSAGCPNSIQEMDHSNHIHINYYTININYYY